MSKSKDILNVGVLGLGTVGGGVVSALQSSPESVSYTHLTLPTT